MPRVGGPELARRLLVEQPSLKVLYVSGYSDPGSVQEAVLGGRASFLQKPFPPSALVRKVREVLDVTGGGSSASPGIGGASEAQGPCPGRGAGGRTGVRRGLRRAGDRGPPRIVEIPFRFLCCRAIAPRARES